MRLFKSKGFWNDNDGISVSELTILLTLPLYLYVGVKYALAIDLTTNQVDFFGILSYPILGAIAKQAIERFGFPNLRRNNNGNYYNGYNGNYNDYGYGYDDNYYNNRGSGTQNNIIITKSNNETENYENRV